MSELIIGSFLNNDHNTGAHKLDKQKNGLVCFFFHSGLHESCVQVFSTYH